MSAAYEAAWVECCEIGCANGFAVHWRHARNFEDRYRCPDHDGTD